MYRLLYQNLHGNHKPKIYIDIHISNKSELKHITKESHQDHKRTEDKKLHKNKSKTINKMAIRIYISVKAFLNVGLNVLT